VARKVLIMAAQQHGNDVEMKQLEPQPVLSIRATVQIVDLAQAQDDRIRALSSYLQQSGAQLAGPPFVRYHTFTETETDLELGIPMVAPIAGEGRIAASSLAGGPAIITWHIGPHDTLAEAYARMRLAERARPRARWRALGDLLLDRPQAVSRPRNLARPLELAHAAGPADQVISALVACFNA